MTIVVNKTCVISRESSSESGSTVVLDTPRHPAARSSDPIMLDLPGTVGGRSQRSPLQSYVEALLESGRHRPPRSDSSDTSDSNITHNITSADDKPKHYYKFFFMPFKYAKIRFDRLALLALLDR